jgi:ubiquinol-cytochrome c reductase cytochrome c subunit
MREEPGDRGAVFLLLSLVALVLAACAGAAVVTATARAQQTSSGPPGSLIFDLNCARCHGPQGQGTSTAPSLAAAGYPSLVAGKVRAGGQGMPAFVGSASAIEAVSTYVASTLSDPTARLADAGTGGRVYRLYCSGCHGATARGGTLTTGENAPELSDVPAADALAAMLLGPGQMPVFASVLTVQQQAGVALYVQSLDSPYSPGGFGLGYLGPVPEGAVAWVALAVLIFIAVWLAWGKTGHPDELGGFLE